MSYKLLIVIDDLVDEMFTHRSWYITTCDVVLTGLSSATSYNVFNFLNHSDSATMAINTILPVVLGFLTIGSLAQAPMGLCTGSDCGYCPNSVTTAGTGYPACVVYDRDTVLGGSAGEYEQTENSARKQIYFDIGKLDPGFNSPRHADTV